MGEVVSFSRAKKTLAKTGKETAAAANRAKHGRTKAAKMADAAEEERRDHLLDGAKREI